MVNAILGLFLLLVELTCIFVAAPMWWRGDLLPPSQDRHLHFFARVTSIMVLRCPIATMWMLVSLSVWLITTDITRSRLLLNLLAVSTALGFVSVILIVLFNQPKLLVPPPFRGEKGLLGPSRFYGQSS
jgi:hypothetical protein